ncbi:NmrA/HSCARG family protein [Paenibacillus radicis (ex Xue et al. 2023)]|uniref:NmrA/HSCARG family protein n=1 Tax=Paenibacillus radicis (ex Xue et al. 2023) TaxID=2972489 RepID=A0ABT1YEI2_9BACL|nr:NmrA/HSCARG family protein [Paenibacillus radicis (ex Xue et al. 2023)]MCR8631607.1 NmrA/HSCARG family protein [Paenibacillus radicis (ex Xue et al. 2023)]
MYSVNPKVLIIGATGQQGGAAVRQLLDKGWAVRAMVRDLQKKEAIELQKLGAELVWGDLEQPSSVEEAMRDVYGVFSVQALYFDDLDKEVRHGKIVADAAAAAGVSHLVYSSVSGADRNTGITSFENKGDIERYIHNLNLPATILRPVMFMDNFKSLLEPINELINIPYMGAEESKLQMIAVQDIGAIAAIAFSEPDKYIGKALEIAGDELTLHQIIQMISKVFESHTVAYQTPPIVQEAVNEHDGTKANAFFQREDYLANIQSVRAIHPRLLDYEAWLRLTKLQLQ